MSLNEDEIWQRILKNRKIIGCARCGTIHSFVYVKLSRIGAISKGEDFMYCLNCFAKTMLEGEFIEGEIWYEGEDY